jgi:metal-responsive CopG/Arc/MetJ family transcriptional regulator
MAESKAISIRVPDLLLEKIDRLAEEKYKSHKGTPNRSLVVLDAIVAYFETLSDTDSIDQIITVSDSVSIIEFNKLRDMVITLSDTVKQLGNKLLTTSDSVAQLNENVELEPVDEKVKQGCLDIFTVSDNVTLNGKQLAKRLGVAPSAISSHKNSPELSEWSKEKDPESIGWSYDPVTKKFLPVKPLA